MTKQIENIVKFNKYKENLLIQLKLLLIMVLIKKHQVFKWLVRILNLMRQDIKKMIIILNFKKTNSNLRKIHLNNLLKTLNNLLIMI